MWPIGDPCSWVDFFDFAYRCPLHIDKMCPFRYTIPQDFECGAFAGAEQLRPMRHLTR